MSHKIAIDHNLTNIRRYLEDKGYQTTNLTAEIDDVALIVVTGMESNILGDEVTSTDVPIIEAAGLTADEVFDEVQRRLQVRH